MLPLKDPVLFWGSNGAVRTLMDPFEAMKFQDTRKHLKNHYEMLAKGLGFFKRTFVLVMESINQ